MLRKVVLTVWLLLGVACLFGGAGRVVAASHDAKTLHVVYHLDANNKDTMIALHQVQNQLAAQPHAEIVVVTIGESVPFLTKDAKTAGGYPFALMIQALQGSGVRFEACGNTMKAIKIEPKQLDDGVAIVPSGMAELARLESEGYVYLKP